METGELEKSILDGPVVEIGGYPYLVTPLADGIPRIEPELLVQAADTLAGMSELDFDLILAPEAMGIPLATAISLKTGLPFAVIRKRRYGLPGEIAIGQRTGYSESMLYVNGVEPGSRVAIVDDMVDTGNTMRALVDGLMSGGVLVKEILVAFNRNGGADALSEELGVPIRRILDISVRDGVPEILRSAILRALHHR